MRQPKFARTSLAPLALLAAVLLAAPLVAQVKDHKDIKYPSLPDFKVEKPQVVTLENGMTVFLMEDHELPLIDVIMTIVGGRTVFDARHL